ncbi:hypothetical protein CP532_1858 [Ophiocordyceps camponoti-leonardi (nom. inval.)]|nr:hypothetical protein CP532_1858 [Ophiocordyceps camponoti-leonardi (nom. inval.)]
MADARSLLRQQRAARRVQHPYAAYTDGGKLLCTLCRLQVKAESLWEKHLLSQGHRDSLPRREGDSTTTTITTPTPTTTTTTTTTTTILAQKRPLDEADDGDEGQESRVEEDTLRRKRSKLEAASPVESVKNGGEQISLASPSLMRRTSTTPSQGVELQIPSRPATPSRRDTPSSSASGIAPPPPSRRRAGSNLTPTTTTTALKVDESEWAAFEADIAVESAPYDEDAVISAPAMTAEESAAAAKALHEQTDKLKVDIDLEEEREEAARAMEDEFQDMQELEERVKRLKDRREALRKRSDSHGQDHTARGKPPSEHGRGKENNDAGAVNGVDEEEEDDDDDDEDDDWDGFRFRNS